MPMTVVCQFIGQRFSQQPGPPVMKEQTVGKWTVSSRRLASYAKRGLVTEPYALDPLSLISGEIE